MSPEKTRGWIEMDTAELISLTLLVMFGAMGIGMMVEHYYLRRKQRTKQAH